MRRLMQPVCTMLAVLLSVALLWSVGAPALAKADSPSLDLSQAGSIFVSLEDEDGATATDGSLTLYQVAVLGRDNGDMVYTYTEAFAGYTASLSDVTGSALAESLASFVVNHSVSGTEAYISSDGTASFEGLELGLYLVVQTTASSGYYAVSPFVISLPIDEDGVWVYDVDASPKVELLTEVPEEPANPDTPSETTPTTTTSSKLPQTGQLNWPIPVLAGSGLLLVALGWSLTHSDKRKHPDAA